MTTALSVDVAARTHVGHVRRRNEDAVYVGEWLYVVADGLGGHVSGDIASTTALEAVKPYDRHVPDKQLADVLGRAISDADAAIRRRVRAEPELVGMATTMVAVLRSDNCAVLANIGDSRAYVMRNHRSNGMLTQVSEDHTYQHLIAAASEVPNLSEKLTRYLDGRKDGRSPDLTALRLSPGDRVLLCSDGLSSYVPHEVIRTILQTSGSLAKVADALVASALNQGGPDNVTVCVIDVVG